VLLSERDQLMKRLLIPHGQIGQHLAVDLDSRLLQARNEAAVRQAVLAGRGVDPGDPKLPKLPLAHPAVAVGVHQRLHHLLVGRTEELALASPIPLGELENLFMTAPGDDAPFGSWHFSPTSSKHVKSYP